MISTEYEAIVKNSVEYPLVCETCLGPNHCIRMQKFPEGGVCHVSGRPYDVFRWKAGSGARYKKTVICQDLAKLKDVCQVCMLDLKYNLPTQVRDKLMNIPETLLPKSSIGREVSLRTYQKENQTNKDRFDGNLYGDSLVNIIGTEPYYVRNQPRVCSFFIKGNCNRGFECPFRHTVPLLNQSKQNYHDRYHGINDAVAHKMLARAANMLIMKPPVDSNIKTLFIGNVTSAVTAQVIKDKLYNYGEIEAIRMVYRRNCAFVTFCSRFGAEKAVLHLKTRLVLEGHPLSIRWSKLAR